MGRIKKEKTVTLHQGGTWKKKDIVNGTIPNIPLRWGLEEGFLRTSPIENGNDQSLFDQAEIDRIETLLRAEAPVPPSTEPLPNVHRQTFERALDIETAATHHAIGEDVLPNPREADRLYRQAFPLYTREKTTGLAPWM